MRLRPCRDAQHEIYAIVRNAMEIIESCGLERELRREAVRKLRARPGGATDAQVIAEFEDGWLLTDAAWVRCAGDAAKLATSLAADEEGRVVMVDLDDREGAALVSTSPMQELPASVGRLQALKGLHLGGCRGLTSLPAELGGLQALKELNLGGCRGLTSLPAELGGLQALEKLGMDNCKGLTSLPAELGGLQALKKLDICYCTGLTSLPAELGGLQALEELILGECKGLTSLPAELGGLQELVDLNLYECTGLTSLPDLSGLEKLKGMDQQQPKQLKPWVVGGRKAFALG